MRIFWIGLVVGQTPSPWVIRLCVKRTFLEHSQRKTRRCKDSRNGRLVVREIYGFPNS